MGLKTVFVIAITTARIIFPNIPMNINTPGSSTSPNTSMASKSVVMSLSSDKKTSEIPSAEVAIPEGLGLGASVKLKVEFTESAPAAETKNKPASSNTYTAKTYWGSVETVPAGQPKITQIEPECSVTTGPQGGSYAYWPVGYRGEKTPKMEAKAPGTYTLTTNYAGGTSVTIDSEQDFLAPIDLISPTSSVDLNKPVKVQWDKVPGALGYVVAAYGGNNAGTITWTSSAVPGAADGLDEKALAKKDLDGLIGKKIVLPADVDSCTIPAGIFKGSNSVIINITALGMDKIQTGGDIESQVVVRSTLSLPLLTGVSPAPPVKSK